MTKKVDFLIVGQGIAGTMLAWFLEKRGKSFFLIDKYNPSSSSQVAAGIIHPITGRRIVKTWMADALIPFARNAYREIEKFFSIPIFNDVPVLELVDSVKEYNDWLARSASPEMKEYISIVPSPLEREIGGVFKQILINHSGWLDMKLLLQTFRNYFEKKKLLADEPFDYEFLKLSGNTVAYQNIEADKIIFCEGVAAMQNPFWKHLPFLPAKGEILTIRCQAISNYIITKKIFILPIGNDLFKVGSTYDWQDLTETPTEKAKQQLLAQLEKIIKIPYEVINHEASVRPTVKDRRPFIGLHPQHPQVAILNGLGTKGALLAPYFANQLADQVMGNS